MCRSAVIPTLSESKTLLKKKVLVQELSDSDKVSAHVSAFKNMMKMMHPARTVASIKKLLNTSLFFLLTILQFCSK